MDSIKTCLNNLIGTIKFESKQKGGVIIIKKEENIRNLYNRLNIYYNDKAREELPEEGREFKLYDVSMEIEEDNKIHIYPAYEGSFESNIVIDMTDNGEFIIEGSHMDYTYEKEILTSFDELVHQIDGMLESMYNLYYDSF